MTEHWEALCDLVAVAPLPWQVKKDRLVAANGSDLIFRAGHFVTVAFMPELAKAMPAISAAIAEAIVEREPAPETFDGIDPLLELQPGGDECFGIKPSDGAYRSSDYATPNERPKLET